ncbi:hypothetical protein BDY21DRAFT_83136 [Lineolata rhizophorae]|uniref:Uncharacterized protein n=1 Tax=Lineolata rhizophorae TaxID=578093 RepID=A0A6A6PBK9_9PEZI|nr:hypothetical protein BDY21DRAFT_83136 [Lineolata rhizophorae]
MPDAKQWRDAMLRICTEMAYIVGEYRLSWCQEAAEFEVERLLWDDPLKELRESDVWFEDWDESKLAKELNVKYNDPKGIPHLAMMLDGAINELMDICDSLTTDLSIMLKKVCWGGFMRPATRANWYRMIREGRPASTYNDYREQFEDIIEATYVIAASLWRRYALFRAARNPKVKKVKDMLGCFGIKSRYKKGDHRDEITSRLKPLLKLFPKVDDLIDHMEALMSERYLQYEQSEARRAETGIDDRTVECVLFTPIVWDEIWSPVDSGYSDSDLEWLSICYSDTVAPADEDEIRRRARRDNLQAFRTLFDKCRNY